MVKAKRKKTVKKQPIIAPVNKKFAIGFAVITVILILIVGYFALAKATIYLSPKKQPISTQVEIEVLPSISSTLTGSNILPGEVIVKKETVSDQFSSSGMREKQVKAKGIVTIVNNYSRPQTLIATTRLLSPEGKLFRLTKTVVVPPGGKVNVEVEADQPGSEYEIGPTRFTIPGLWEGLQDKIYGISDQPMSKTTQKENYITATDVEKAKQRLQQLLEKKIRDELKGENKQIIVKSYILSTELDKKIGEVSPSFTLTITAKVVGVAIDKDKLKQTAENNLKLNTPNNLEYLSFNPDSINLTLIKANDDGSSATLQMYVEGIAVVKLDNLYKVDDILGFAKQDVEKYFLSIKGVESVKVHFTPAWVKSVPPLKDHVEIKIIK